MSLAGENKELEDLTSFSADLDRFSGPEKGKWDPPKELLAAACDDKM